MAFTPLDDRQPHFLTQEEAMALAHEFPELEKTELLHGVLWHKVSGKPPHEVLKERLLMWLARGVDPARFAVRVEAAFSVRDRHSMPEPDLMVVEGPGSFEHPRASPLVIEVSHTSFRRDTRIKAPLYAATGVPEYWIVDVERRRLLVHSGPAEDGYDSVRTHTAPERVRPEFVEVEPIDLDELFAGLEPSR